MKPNNKYTLYFKREWVTAGEINHEFVEHALHFNNGVSEELRSYGYNGGPHVFKAKKYFETLIFKAEEQGMFVQYTADELINITYELLEKNQLVNATLIPIIYLKDGEVNLMISAKKADPFTVRENLQLDEDLYSNVLNVSSSGKLNFSSENPFFFIKHGVLYTPKVEEDDTPGVIRDTIIECAIALGYPVIEKRILISEIEESEVVFFSNHTHEMSFVQRFKNFTFHKNWRETMAMDLLMMFRQQATNEDFWNYSII